MSEAKKIEFRSWSGGRIRTGRNGEDVFVIERMKDGKRYTKTLEASSEKAAELELTRFMDNPAGYRSPSERRTSATVNRPCLSEDLRGRLKERMVSDGLDETHIRSVTSYLRQWSEKLGDRDLRTVTLADYRAALASWTKAKKYRTISLKTFTSFLRSEGLLARHEDASLEVEVPTSVAGKAVEDRAYEIKHVETVYRHVNSQVVRDVLLVSAKTGLHQKEIGRMAAGFGRLWPTPDQGEIAGVLEVKHKRKYGKNRAVHVQSVDAQTYAAIERLIARTKVPSAHTVHGVIATAAKNAGVTAINPGQLRHCFITWNLRGGHKVVPKEGGVSLEDVRVAVNHSSTNITREHYAGTYVPPMLVPPVSLVHPEDPVSMTGKRKAG